jgi:hypothetical protein
MILKEKLSGKQYKVSEVFNLVETDGTLKTIFLQVSDYNVGEKRYVKVEKEKILNLYVTKLRFFKGHILLDSDLSIKDLGLNIQTKDILVLDKNRLYPITAYKEFKE